MAFILSSQCLPHAGLSFVRSHHRSLAPQCVVLPSSSHWSSKSSDEGECWHAPRWLLLTLGISVPHRLVSNRLQPPWVPCETLVQSFFSSIWSNSAAQHAACSVSPERSSWRPGASDSVAVSWRLGLAAALLGVRGARYPVSLLLLRTTLSPWFKMTTTEKTWEGEESFVFQASWGGG